MSILLSNYALAYDFVIGAGAYSFFFNITSNEEPYTVEVTNETGEQYNTHPNPSGDLYIPETIEYNNITYTVTRIGDKAFKSTDITSVIIPSSVTSIGNYAFAFCSNLTEVNFNAINCTTIGSPEYPAFKNCSSLVTFNIGENVRNIPDYALYNCSSITDIFIPEWVTSIGEMAFYGCGMTEITITDSITSIGQGAFGYCTGLCIVNFNAINCTSMGSYEHPVFEGCSNFDEVYFGENVTNIPDGAFNNCSGLTSVTIPNSVENIGSAFGNCSGLITVNFNATNCVSMNMSFSNCEAFTTLNIGENVTIIPNNAFADCRQLTMLTIPNSVMNIGDAAFMSCSGLEKVKIGNSVEYVGGEAFDGCGNITEITIYANTPPSGIPHSCFTETTYQTATLWVPRGTLQAYSNASQWGQFRDIRELPYWSCDFEGEEIWTVGNDQQNGNVQWQIVTPETYPTTLISGDNAYIKPFVFQGDTLNNTPGHWAIADLISQSTDLGGPGQVAESSWIEFDNINLIEAEQPQITFRQIFRQLNGVETSIRVSIDGGQTWTDHIVNEEVEGNTYGEYEIRTGIFEAAGEENVIIRFLFNSDAHTTQMGYGWEIDDIIINEAPDTIIATAGEGGTISPSGEVLVNHGDDASFSITPNTGYQIASVMVDRTENVTEQLVEGVYTFGNVTANHTIEATFEAIHATYTITVLANNDEYGTVSGGGTYEEGTDVVITAMPNSDYCFLSWDDGDTFNPRTITVTSDSTFIADFSATAHLSIDTTVTKYLTIADRTFYIAGQYSFVILSEVGCDTIIDLNLRILDEPETYDISPNPAKSIISISSEDYISFVEFYSTAGRLAMRKEINAYQAEINVEELVSGVYFVRLHGEDVSLPSIQRFVKE